MNLPNEKMSEAVKQELQQLCGQISFDEPLSRHTSMRVGGPADAFVSPQTIEELLSLLNFARRQRLPVWTLGAGTNVLIRDKGMRGLVIHLARGFGRLEKEREEDKQVFVYAEAGVGVPRLVEFGAEEGLASVEVLSGIPGNIGGALVMNAGTQEGSISDVVQEVSFLTAASREDYKLVTWPREKIDFGYRQSRFPSGSLIISTRLRFARQDSSVIREKIAKQRTYRLDTQPLNVPNIGSVFKNTQVKKKTLFAARLIEEAGLKGVRVGGARISEKHANWIVNEGGATARDVLALMGLMKDKVKEKFDVLLEPEVKVVGEA